LIKFKESVIKNDRLKELEIFENQFFKNGDDLLKNENHLFYKMLKLKSGEMGFWKSFSKNIYLSKNCGVGIKQNYFKCFIDHLHILFLNFMDFDFIFFFNKK
jgi:hypothetical protein